MVSFTYICRNIAGTQPTKGEESGTQSCAKHLPPGKHCMPGTEALAAEAKKKCPSADFIRVPSFRKT